MPLLEEEASVDTACISTAPVFEAVGGQKDGARKSHSASWWSLLTHNAEKPPGARSTWLHTAMWACWLAAILASVLIPVPEGRWLFTFSFSALIVLSIWIPDYGDTVMPYTCIVITPLVVFKSVAIGGFWNFSILLHVFALIPALDFIVGVDVGNTTKELQRELQHAFRFKLLSMLVAPMVLGCITYGAWLANHAGLSAVEWAGMTLGVGVVTGGVGIVVGHELCHKADAIERLLGRFLLCMATFGHFYVEHTLGHHKHVATDLDPATARFGESFYEFLPRSIKGEFLSACHIEKARLERHGLAWWHSEIPAYWLCSVAISLVLATFTGPAAVPFFFLQSVVAIILFESVNYLEHYGLERRELAPGKYEPVQPSHSWDSPARITNHVMFRLQRHADHHAHAGKRYQTLQAYDTSPQLPSGYPTMMLLAFIPPLWRAVMDPRVIAHRESPVCRGQRFRYGPTPISYPANAALATEVPGPVHRSSKSD